MSPHDYLFMEIIDSLHVILGIFLSSDDVLDLYDVKSSQCATNSSKLSYAFNFSLNHRWNYNFTQYQKQTTFEFQINQFGSTKYSASCRTHYGNFEKNILFTEFDRQPQFNQLKYMEMIKKDGIDLLCLFWRIFFYRNVISTICIFHLVVPLFRNIEISPNCY